MLDLDPWPKTEPEPPAPGISEIIKNFLKYWSTRFNKKNTKPTQNDQGETE
jgi:hypothetical protein